jgi:hypothetical protein
MPIVANEVIPEGAPFLPAQSIPSELMSPFNMPRSPMAFKDLPLDLQKIIERDFEKMANNPDPR